MIDYLVPISSTKVTPETSITKVVHEDRIDPNFAMFIPDPSKKRAILTTHTFCRPQLFEKIRGDSRGSSEQGVL